MDAARPALPGRNRTIAALTIGNALEAFDFTVYTFYAILFGKLFFPAADPQNQLLLSIATFGVGFVVRPLGSVLVGSYADRHGRKAAMTLTIMLMAAGCAMIGLAPTYAQAGLLAPLIIVTARLLQGFSAGGEMGAAVTLLIENGTPRDRSFLTSWFIASQGLGIMFGAGLAALLAFALTPAELEGWGWRIPFLLGVAIAPVGLYIRSRLHETLASAPATAPATPATPAMPGPLATVLRHHKLDILRGVLLIMGSSVSAYVILYMPTYAIRELGLPASSALLAGVASSGISMVLAPLAGRMADAWGRKPLIIGARIASIVLIYPCFLWLSSHPSLPALLLIVAVLSILYTLNAVPTLTMLPEMMARGVRATGTSISAGIGLSLFGGTTQLLVAWLIALTGSKLVPAFYLVAALMVSSLPLLAMRDRTGKPIDGEPPA
ncbi:MAG: MFS transporter [Pseudomonadota bacterium]